MNRRVLHFLALGALLFAGRRALTPDVADVAAAPVADGTVPARAASDPDALLAAAAEALGLDDGDAVIARRRARNLAFLDADEHDTAARALAGDDRVVRRRLATRLRLAIEAAARTPEPDDGELAAHLAAHPEEFALPARAQLAHVYVSRARHGDAAATVAARWQAALRAGADVAGDPLPLPRVLPSSSAAELAAQLGPAVAAAAFALPLGEWSAPLASPLGFHLVRVTAREPARLPPLAAVRAAVRESLLAARAARALAAAEAELRAGQDG